MKQNSVSEAVAEGDEPFGGEMTPAIKLSLPEKEKDLRPRILVIGIGGGGCNAINNMVNAELQGVEFIAANTDAQSLESCKADYCIQLGPELTKGLGAGSKPDVGRAAAEEVAAKITEHLENGNMAFIAAGMGGGTGTGAAPVFARIARDLGLLSIAIVTKPFDFEGRQRLYLAERGIEELYPFVDTLVAVPNQNLFRVASEDTSFCEAFAMADKVLYNGIKSVSSLMVSPGIINLDFADVRSVMEHMGRARIGAGEAEGENRANQAVEAAIANPLLSDSSMRGARAVLVNVTGGHTKLVEVQGIVNRVRQECGGDAHLVFGTGEDETLGDKVRVSLIAAGLEDSVKAAAESETPEDGHREEMGNDEASFPLLKRLLDKLRRLHPLEGGRGEPRPEEPRPGEEPDPRQSAIGKNPGRGPKESPSESLPQPGGSAGPMSPTAGKEAQPSPASGGNEAGMPSALFGGNGRNGEDNLEIPAFLRRGAN